MTYNEMIQILLHRLEKMLAECFQLDRKAHVIWFEDTDTVLVTITVHGSRARTKFAGFAEKISQGMTLEQIYKVVRGMLANNLYHAWQKTIYTEKELEAINGAK